jgi:hypothetical protein
MSIRELIAQKLFAAVIDRLADRKISEQLPAAVDRRLNDIGWRRLSLSPTRELPMMDQPRAIEVAYFLWKTHPMAKWIIEVVTAFVTADGAPYTCKNEHVKDVLDGFWYDPVNRMDLNWETFVREIGIYGEQCWPAFVAEQTGRVKLGYIDPAQISKVEPDPENVKIKIGIEVSGPSGGAPRRYRIILDGEVEDFVSEAGKALRETFTDGEAFFFTVNALTNEMRGSSDLFTVADHIENYEQFIWNTSEKHARFNAFFYDITVEGADPQKLEDERQKYQPPQTGQAFIHNEKVRAEAVAPDMKADDSEVAGRLQRNHILGALGLPEHWYGGGGDVNRATAGEMDAPARKIISGRQKRVKNMLELVFDFQIAKAAGSGYLRGVPENELYSYEVQTPDIADKDVSKLSNMLAQVSTALTAAEIQGWIDKPEAAKAFAYFMAFMGYEYDPNDQDKTPPEYSDYRGNSKGRES